MREAKEERHLFLLAPKSASTDDPIEETVALSQAIVRQSIEKVAQSRPRGGCPRCSWTCRWGFAGWRARRPRLQQYSYTKMLGSRQKVYFAARLAPRHAIWAREEVMKD